MGYAANALTTLEVVKSYVLKDMTDTSKDNLLERLINAVSGFIEKYCDRKFGKATYTEKYRGNNRQLLRLNQYPVTAVTLVTIDGNAVNDYEILAEEGMLYRENLWTWTGYSIGLVGEDAGSKRNIEVQYTAGYVLPKDENLQANPPIVRTLPYDLEQACILMVQYYYKTDISYFSTEFAESGSVFKPVAMPGNVEKLLKPYRRLSAL